MAEKITNIIKLFLLIFMMTTGFFLTYCFLWSTLGFQLTDLTICIAGVLALLSELGYIKWIVKVERS